MNIKTLSNKDANWPNALDNITPKVDKLFLRGHLPDGPRLGVIGSRRPTDYGRLVTEQIVEPLARAGVTIVSGLAIGIDGLAHQHALEAGGKTIAILPSGLGRVYPARHARLLDNICEDGAALTEYPELERAQKSHFIARNRIIAGMSDLLLVIEAAERSGTMHTVEFANQLGGDVAAVPGPINSLYSRGTNRILKDGAYLVDSADTVLSLMGLEQSAKPEKLNLSKQELDIYMCLEREPLTFTGLMLASGVSETDLRTHLSSLELNNLVARQSGGMYARRG